MKIVLDEWFRLPKLGSDDFIKLVKEANLKYESKYGFKADINTNLPMVASILKSVLGKDVEFAIKCFICGKVIKCRLCDYDDICDKLRISPKCICNECEKKNDLYALYTSLLAMPKS
ncbi:MAG: hypothetical protein RMJ31_06240 [Nitrososphaerota archaeon]|nr:hypothetical protein [Nitrososphaerales archaeon]MDW8045352.1 hypothetical protein [Nitrososphaerota archaeon]